MKGENNYDPTTGEKVLISPPNYDDEKGYFYLEHTVLWQSDIFILYGDSGKWPNLNKKENVHIKQIKETK